MPSIETISLPFARTGTARALRVFRFGTPGARPKVYVQGSLHADEIPGMFTAHHLVERLAALEAAGGVRGEVVVVPVANPIGLDQVVTGSHLGRFALATGSNFNREYPDLSEDVAMAVRDRLGPDAARNVALVRAEALAALDRRTARTEVEALRLALFRLAVDADIVLDLHCDSDALMHIYVGTSLWPGAADLSAQLGAAATFLATESGGHPFDEACSGLWWLVRQRLGGQHPIPDACLAATVELRGRGNVSDALNGADADNIVKFLQRRGVLAGDPGPLPPLPAEATPLAGADLPEAPCAGVVAYRVRLGDIVAKGDVVAEIVDPSAAPGTPRTPVRAQVAGPVIVLKTAKYVGPGDNVAMIAGRESIRSGKLLTA